MNLDDLITPKPVEKIYGWMDTQLSIARFYGGCTYKGHPYLIDMQDPDKPLVRQDVLRAEIKARKVAASKQDSAAKAVEDEKTQDLFESGA